MTENATISQFIPSQFPDFIRDSYPKFIDFLKVYYEFLEQPNNPVWKVQRILDEISLDTASEESIDHFVSYVGKYLPAEYSFDKAHLIKFIKEFYLSRGTSDSYKFFFSMLYGTEVGKQTSIEFPEKNVLHASLGEWTEKKSVKIEYTDTPISNFVNQTITSGNDETAIIESSISYIQSGKSIIELFLQVSSITGDFIPGTATVSNIGEVNIIPVITGVSISNYGSGYTTDDVVTGYGDGYLVIGDSVDGEVYRIDVINSGIDNTVTEALTITSVDGADFAASTTIGAISNYPGFWKTNRNQISQANVRLEDNFYYQQFSYVINSPIALNVYENKVLDAIHPSGRKMFGKFLLVDQVDALSTSSLVDGSVDALIDSVTQQDKVELDWESDGYITALITDETPEALFKLEGDDYMFLASRVFYPNEDFASDEYFSDDFGGEYSFDNTSTLDYIGGNSNTEAMEILSGGIQPDPVIYRFPFSKTKAKLWLTGASKVIQKTTAFKFTGADTTKWKVDDSHLFNFGTNPFSLFLQFRPHVAEDKALLSMCYDPYPTEATLVSSIWGGSAGNPYTPVPSEEKARVYGIGMNAARRVYVNLFNPTDDDTTNSVSTYTHTSVLALDTWHSVLVSYNDATDELKITVDGNSQTFTHSTGLKLPTNPPPLVIGGTKVQALDGSSLTFNGLIRNVGIWNRIVDATTEYANLTNKIYKQLPALQKHGLVFFTELGYSEGSNYISDLSGYNAHITPYTAGTVANTFDATDNFTVSTQSRYGISEIYDQTYWNGLLNVALVTNADSKQVMNSSFGNKENLIIGSTNGALNPTGFSNYTTRVFDDSIEIEYPAGTVSNSAFRLIDNVIAGNYVLSFEIENNISDAYGNIKGFSIDYGTGSSYLYKQSGVFVKTSNVEYEIIENGSWIKITVQLTDVPYDAFEIETGTTDSLGFYTSGFTAISNPLKLRNFQLRGTETSEDYIRTFQTPIIAGSKPSIRFNNFFDGYALSTTRYRFNMTNKAIFYVCGGGKSKIVSGPDFELKTNPDSNVCTFTVNKNGTPVSITTTDTKQLRMLVAYHIGTDVYISNSIASGYVEDSDVVAITAPSTGNQTYTFFADNADVHTMYEMIILEDPTMEEVLATKNTLAAKYNLAI